MQLYTADNSTYLKEYPCTLVRLGDHVQPHCSKCSLSDTKSSDLCGPVDPAPYDNRSHVAVVPCENGTCSWKEKAQNLGQANYSVFITWKGHNCSGGGFVLLFVEHNQYWCTVVYPYLFLGEC